MVDSSPLPAAKTEVLVVDDEDGIRTLLAAVLPARGLPVRTAGSGEEAVAIYRQHHPTIGLVLLDVSMFGQDGPQTLAALRAIDPQVRCCFMTGGSARYSLPQLRSLQPLEVLLKPLPPTNDLVAILRRFLQQPSAGL